MSAERDAIVIGAGIAGLVAAARMAQLGLKPLVLEKSPDEDYACNSRYSGGVFHICYRDPVATNSDDLFAEIETANAGECNLRLAQSVASNARRMMLWLHQEGLRFMKGGPNEFQNHVLSPPRLSEPGLFWRGRGGDLLLKKLAENLTMRGGAIQQGCRANRIEMLSDGGYVVREASSDDKRSYTARAVVIADGGFTGNPKLLGRYISAAPERLLQRSAATACGDGLSMAIELGAATTHMGCFYGHVLARQAFSNNALWPFPMLDPIATAGVVVTSDGRRFVDEGRGGIFIANAIARLSDPLSAALVFDKSIWTGIATHGVGAANPTLLNRGGALIQANSLGDLAKHLNIPENEFLKTMSSYNSAISLGEGANMLPPRTANKARPVPIQTPPFYAIEVCAGVTNAMGGLAIDEYSRVLRTDGKPIPGLYAAGTATGGLEGGVNVGYLGGLAKGAITGLLAAENIASSLSQSQQSLA